MDVRNWTLCVSDWTSVCCCVQTVWTVCVADWTCVLFCVLRVLHVECVFVCVE